MINIISPAYHKNYSHYCGLWDGGLYKGRDWGVCGEYQLCRSELVCDPSSQRKIETMHPASDFPKNLSRRLQKVKIWGQTRVWEMEMNQEQSFSINAQILLHTPRQILLYTYYKFYYGFSCYILTLWFFFFLILTIWTPWLLIIFTYTAYILFSLNPRSWNLYFIFMLSHRLYAILKAE